MPLFFTIHVYHVNGPKFRRLIIPHFFLPLLSIYVSLCFYFSLLFMNYDSLLISCSRGKNKNFKNQKLNKKLTEKKKRFFVSSLHGWDLFSLFTIRYPPLSPILDEQAQKQKRKKKFHLKI